METYGKLSELGKALAKAQSEFKVADKDATNPHFKSKFASYESIHDAVVPALNANGIALLQPAFSRDGLIGIRTILLHTSGEWVTSELAMPMPSKVQEAGSLLSYLKRYSLADAVGAKVAELDDDAESIERPARSAPKSAPVATPVVNDAAEKMRAAVAAKPAPPPDIMARKAALLAKLANDFGPGDCEWLSKTLGRKVTSLASVKFQSVEELEKVEKALVEYGQETMDFFEQAAAIHAEGVAAKAKKESK